MLLEPDRIRADRHPYPDLTHYAMAAYGALIHDDKPSFQRALALWAQEVVDMPSLQRELAAMEHAAADRRGWKVT